MVEPCKTLKRTVKLIVNLITLLCSIILLVLVTATQTDIPASVITVSGTPRGYMRDVCTLNVGAVGVCAYAYILGGVGIALALFVIFLTLMSCITDQDAPVILDGSIHALAAVWWVIGVAVLGTFVARANGKRRTPASALAPTPTTPLSPNSHPQPHPHHYDFENGARVGLVLTALVNAVLYALSLWTNACCCIARYKHETVSMYV